VSKSLVVEVVRGVNVARLQRPGVGQGVGTLQALNVSDNLLGFHLFLIPERGGQVNRPSLMAGR